jgi:hypothetical protein
MRLDYLTLCNASVGFGLHPCHFYCVASACCFEEIAGRRSSTGELDSMRYCISTHSCFPDSTFSSQFFRGPTVDSISADICDHAQKSTAPCIFRLTQSS